MLDLAWLGAAMFVRERSGANVVTQVDIMDNLNLARSHDRLAGRHACMHQRPTVCTRDQL